MKFRNFFLLALLMPVATVFAQEDAEAISDVEEVVVVGSQIKGASITGALPVSVISAEEIDALGVDSGDDLLENIAENGMNMFNEAENISGGVNSARGDIGAYNLRNMGTGNTLVLLNGRRLVNSPGYQTEYIGGDFVPAMTVNSNLIPVYGQERLEILRDGASAIYGADAVAGVVNHVLQSDFEGFMIRGKRQQYDHFMAEDTTVTAKFGMDFNNGATNVGVFFDHYDRGKIRAMEDERWGAGDLRPLIPQFLGADSPWIGNSRFRNTSANSLYGQFDMVSSSTSIPGTQYDRVWTDSSGEFEMFPMGDERCTNRGNPLYDTGYGTCIAPDGNGTIRYNFSTQRDVRSELERQNILMFINHELAGGAEAFTELGFYQSDSQMDRHASYAFTSSKHRVGPDNYWLNQMLYNGDAVFGGQQLYIDFYRYAEKPRDVNVEKETYRFLQGLRGSTGKWDWEMAYLNSEAKSDDVTHNRVSNNLLKEALFDSTPNAYNPFAGGDPAGFERIAVSVYRKGVSSLEMFDFKMSTPDLFEMPAGSVGLLLGFEWRNEEVIDNRDPRLDGTIPYTDYEGDTHPYVSDVVNSSPTNDVFGQRETTSLLAELSIPLMENMDMQLALRHEDASDFESNTVGKLALGYRPTDWLLVRGSTSTSFRAPNIIQINEKIVARTGSRYDYVYYHVAEILGLDPDEDVIDYYGSMQRVASGAENLKAEESTNTSFGIVLEPLDGLTITADTWSIEKENTIGLFGRANHTTYDLLLNLLNGGNDCANFVGNSAVVREDPDQDVIDLFAGSGLCPVGPVRYVNDNYINLATRTIEGTDIGVYYNFETSFGDFSLRYIGTYIDLFDQTPDGDYSTLVSAQQSGLLDQSIPLEGFGDLLGLDGNYDEKHTLRATWRNGPWQVTTSSLTKGEFYQDSLTLSDGTRFEIPSMTTHNLTVAYYFDRARVKLGINNVEDERAPLADRYFGYYADAHQDYGRYYYLDVRMSF